MTGLIRWVRGTVRFRVKGGFPERFINLCAARGIPLWDAGRREGCCMFTTYARLYRRLRPCARSAGAVLQTVRRRGLPFWLRRRRRRWPLAVGAAVCLVLLWVSSLFLWEVRVVGNQQLEQQLILQTLSEQGVRPGVLTSSIDVRRVERHMMMELKELGWVALNLRGSTAEVQIKERVMPPVPVNRQEPCNVVAARAGQITEMRVYTGQNMVAVGDAVAEGDILVSGVVQDADRDIHLVSARADILAETARTLQVEVPLEQQKLRLEQVVRRTSLRLGSLEIPLWVGKPPQGRFRLERMYTPLCLFGRELPVAVGQRSYLMLAEERVTLSPGLAKEQALARLEHLEEQSFGQGRVLERRLAFSQQDGLLCLTADYRVEELISVQSEIFVNNEEN